MSVKSAMRTPFSAAGRPATGSVASVAPRRWRSYATPYAAAPPTRPTVPPRTPFNAARRVRRIDGYYSTGLMDLFSELEWRGLVYDATEGVRDALAREKVTGYIGFDPTAASLHVGSLLMMMALAHMQRHGHSPVAVVGRGTGLIGDPSGKSAERQLMPFEQVETNVAGIRGQLSRFLDFDSKVAPARLVNNADWLTKLSAVDFMRDVGKHFTINAMLAKESVKRRIESEDGITYTEFSYSLLQAYDFLELYDRLGCTLQMGGSDQWGNITAGMDLIRRLRGGKAHGLVLPLIPTAAGAKFGMRGAGTIWLDPDLTSPYQFYQFWLNVDDQDAVRLSLIHI